MHVHQTVALDAWGSLVTRWCSTDSIRQREFVEFLAIRGYETLMHMHQSFALR
jgi:hypothetical protein